VRRSDPARCGSWHWPHTFTVSSLAGPSGIVAAIAAISSGVKLRRKGGCCGVAAVVVAVVVVVVVDCGCAATIAAAASTTAAVMKRVFIGSSIAR
jgi:uncharacterized membrane protein